MTFGSLPHLDGALHDYESITPSHPCRPPLHYSHRESKVSSYTALSSSFHAQVSIRVVTSTC